jgi:transcriptional regulator of acetoin/glycerol metabolism
MKAINWEQPDFYGLVKTVLQQFTHPLNKDAVKTQIIKVLQERDLADYYYAAIRQYMYNAIENRDPDAKAAFIEVFFDDIESVFGTHYATAQIAMKLEGIHDLLMIDYKRTASPDDIPPARIARIVHYHAKLDRPVMIIGETGTGKELMARAVHTISNRRKMPFREINCAAIPEKLLESELFGYEKGAFSGAMKRKLGIFELANGGTIFLDELGKMSPRLQAKILKVVEEKKFNRLGSDEKKPIEIDVRFLAATQPIDKLDIIPDLVYRLGDPAVIRMTTLNERLKELGPSLIDISFRTVLQRIGMGNEKITITPDGYEFLMDYSYEGNYRQLENMLLGAVINAQASLPIRQRGGTYVYMEGSKLKAISAKDLLSCAGTDAETLRCEERDKDTGVNHTNIPLKDIVDYAEGVMRSIIEAKVKKVIDQGGDIKQTLIYEGLPGNQYQNYYKKITTRIGKGARDLKNHSSVSTVCAT